MHKKKGSYQEHWFVAIDSHALTYVDILKPTKQYIHSLMKLIILINLKTQSLSQKIEVPEYEPTAVEVTIPLEPVVAPTEAELEIDDAPMIHDS